MTSRSLLTVTAVVAVLYGLAFLLIPDGINALYGVPSAPHTALYTRFFGSALLGFGVIDWFAKDFRSWDATRGVLIGTAVTTAVGGLIALSAVVTGLSNAMTWTSVLVYALLFVGGGIFALTGREEFSRGRHFRAVSAHESGRVGLMSTAALLPNCSRR